MKSTAAENGNGRRIPALEIEQKTAAAVVEILDDRAAIAKELDLNFDAAKIKLILENSARWSKDLCDEEKRATALASVLDRADIAENGIRLSIRIPLVTEDHASATAKDFLVIQRFVPMQVRRRGIEMRLVLGGEESKVDAALLKAVARADQWLAELLSGRSGSLDEIGKRTGVGKRYVSRMIRLAFLAPSIVEQIANGRQPPELTVQALSTRRGDLPLSWCDQRKLLGCQSQ